MMQESSAAIVAALDGLPLVLMTSEGGSQQEVWRSIELGAADCLEKPLSPLKLRNIWQHVVRKVSAPLISPWLRSPPVMGQVLGIAMKGCSAAVYLHPASCRAQQLTARHDTEPAHCWLSPEICWGLQMMAGEEPVKDGKGGDDGKVREHMHLLSAPGWQLHFLA